MLKMKKKKWPVRKIKLVFKHKSCSSYISLKARLRLCSDRLPAKKLFWKVWIAKSDSNPIWGWFAISIIFLQMLLSLDVPPAQNRFQICITLNVTHNDYVKIGD